MLEEHQALLAVCIWARRLRKVGVPTVLPLGPHLCVLSSTAVSGEAEFLHVVSGPHSTSPSGRTRHSSCITSHNLTLRSYTVFLLEAGVKAHPGLRERERLHFLKGEESSRACGAEILCWPFLMHITLVFWEFLKRRW